MEEEIKCATKIKKLLAHKTKLLHQSQGPLTSLWRVMLNNLNIDITAWKSLMSLYLTDPDSAIGTKKEDLDNARGKLTKSLPYDNMSMKVFQNGLKFLRCERVTFVISLTPKDKGIKTIHQTDIWYGINTTGIKNDTPKKQEVPVNRFKKLQQNMAPAAKSILGDKSGSKAILALLSDPNKKIEEATDVLSRLWRQILKNLDLNESVWKGLMNTYLNAYVPEHTSTKDRSNVEGNFNKVLVKDRMTMDVFLKALALLQIEKYELKLTVKRKNLARISVHKVAFPVPDPVITFRPKRMKPIIKED